MKHLRILTVLAALLVSAGALAVNQKSIYTQKPDDADALFFTPEAFGIRADGKTDVSEALQAAINQVKTEKSFGILYIPEGRYRISRTIYIPGAVRVIGYGAKRPEIILAKNSAGFQEEVPGDKGKAKYMFWFTGGIVSNESRVGDAGAGTFYSCMSNIDLRIEDGNPQAVALRTHFAQHSFVSYMTINIGKGKAGLFDVGNEMENIAFIGGEYGIYSTKASPGWQVMMADCYFEGQRKAAIFSQEAGLAMVNLQVKKVPTVFEIQEGYNDRVFIENGRFENVSGPAFVVSLERNANTDLVLRDIWCSGVPQLVGYRRTGEVTTVPDKVYHIKSFNHGLQMASMVDEPQFRTDMDIEPAAKLPAVLANDIPQLPAMETWVSVKDFGAKGDGVTDDTEAIRRAVAAADNIYFPTGWYVVSETIRMRPDTKFIGLHPFATQLKLAESTPAFSGFGSPVALLESSEGGTNYLNGIGINTGAYNYRAVGVKWMAGAASYMNDVKYVGGHGTMSKPRPRTAAPAAAPQGGRQQQAPRVSTPESPVRNSGFDQAWDNQYYSLWVTNNGGGTFKDIWTASTYVSNGFYAENTSTPSRIYAMSIEHHVRNEVRFNRVSNWKVYAMQTEEESVESIECQPIEMDDCSNIRFATLYMFRVIRVNRPYHSSVRIRNCRDIEFINVHNFGQVMYSNDIPVFDQGKGLEVRPWEFARLTVTGDEPSAYAFGREAGKAAEVGSDFEFAQGAAADSKGNFYFCDTREMRIWKWNAEKGLTLLSDIPWEPYQIGVDTEDNVIVTFRYYRQPGFEGDTIDVSQLPDVSGTSFGGWGNSGFAIIACSIDPDNVEESVRLLDRVPMASMKNVAKALYPSNRWRDYHDFPTAVTYVPQNCFVAPDGKTIIPEQYDLARSASLVTAVPGKKAFLADDYDRKVVCCDVAADGTLSNLADFSDTGEFGVAVADNGDVYFTDGDVKVYDKDGNYKNTIKVAERPNTLAISGDTLFITGRSKIFAVKIK